MERMHQKQQAGQSCLTSCSLCHLALPLPSEVFQCCQAATALAKRGENIVRCFIGVSPGGVLEEQLFASLVASLRFIAAWNFRVLPGVGQSLYSAHLDLCQNACDRREVEVDEKLLERGNCILLAITRLLPSKKGAVISELRKTSQQNNEAARVGSRSYADVTQSLRIHAVPCLGLAIDAPGSYLLHSEHQGRPHCLSCSVQDNGVAEIGDGKYLTQMKCSELQKFADEAIDSSSLVTFRLFDNKRKAAVAAATCRC